MNPLKDSIRPPFANDDMVVYFGGGLFTIPFLNRYFIKPLHLKWPNFDIEMKSDIAAQIVSGLCLAFTIYILGHLIAFLGSQFIEKSIDRIFGKVSSSIIISAYTTPKKRNEIIRAMIFDRAKTIKEHNAIFPTIVRCIPHIPIIPAYAAIFIFGIFGYYNTRVPRQVLNSVRHGLKDLGIGDVTLSIRSPWFKALEYCVINRSPLATARMYNYLVIGGLFRTLCIIFLIAAWAQLYFILHYCIDGDWMLGPALGVDGAKAGAFELFATILAYVFCLFSYIKFQRRYAEEAIFAFVFDRDVSRLR